MIKILRQIITAAKDISLTQAEQVAMRRAIAAHMRAYEGNRSSRHTHAIPSPFTASGTMERVTTSTWLGRTQVILSHITIKRTVPVLILLLVAASGSLSYAAEGTLPGNPLYLIKTNINEEAISLVTYGGEARAEWERARAERRLEEATSLASRGELTNDRQAVLEKKFQEHATALHKTLATLQSTEDLSQAAEINSEFEASLIAHGTILSQIEKDHAANDQSTTTTPIESETGKSNDDNVGKVVASIKTEAENTIGSRVALEAEIKATTTLDKIEKSKLQTVVITRHDRASNLISAIKDALSNAKNLSTDARTEINAELDAAQATLDAGNGEVALGHYGDAFASFQKARRIALEARLDIKAASSLKMHLPKSGILNTTIVSTALATSDQVSSSTQIRNETGKNDPQSASSTATSSERGGSLNTETGGKGESTSSTSTHALSSTTNTASTSKPRLTSTSTAETHDENHGDVTIDLPF